MRAIAVMVVLGAAIADAGDEAYRDMSTKEALYISDGPLVAYRGPRGGDPKPLTLLGHEEGDRILKVRFKKSPTVWTLTISADRQKLICEAPGEPRQVFERSTPEKIAALAMAKADAGTAAHSVVILRPEDDSASYEPVVEFEGEVSPGAQSITVFAFDGKGRQQDEHTLGKFKPGDRTFLFRAGKGLNNMSIGTNRYRVEAKFDDGAIAKTQIKISLHEYTGEEAKPVIYLYPLRPQRVSVKVEPVGGLIKSEPPYGHGWSVKAFPDGRILAADGTVHPYLFWESGLTAEPQPLREGFCVPREGLDAFFGEQLMLLGLAPNEIADFKEFWMPKLTARPFAAVRFVPREEIDATAPLTVVPAPDSIIRVLIDFRAHDEPVELQRQVLTPAARKGFAVVEWGGLLYRE